MILQQFMWALSLFVFTAFDSKEAATRIAWTELGKYCEEERIDCSNAKMETPKKDGLGWFFDFVISAKPEHLVTMKIGPFGNFELWRSKEQ